MSEARKINPEEPLGPVEEPGEVLESLDSALEKSFRGKAPTWKPKAGLRERLEVSFEVVTPVFGGGVWMDPESPRKPIDKVTPIRTASIRGHLRFWWREVKGDWSNRTAMKKREAEIWGATSEPGRVSLAVTRQPLVKQANEVGVYEVYERDGRWRIRTTNNNLAYAAFPLQTQHAQLRDPKNRTPGTLQNLDESVVLRLDFPSELRGDVEAALDAWLSFGGIGGRTRRGFGAVHADERAAFEDERFETFRIAAGKSAQEALERGLGKLQRFRQGEGVGRNKGQHPRRPGRSRWPEPEAIRELTKQWDPNYKKRFVNVDKFPRAAFGMPIIFHFQSRQDPRDTSLQPIGKERMASPLIIRPVKRPGDSSWTCLGIRLPNRDTPRLELAQAVAKNLSADLSEAEVRRITPLGGEPDPIEAFKIFCAKTP